VDIEKIVARLVERVERRFHGKYRGIVVDNADPEQLGRLRLRVPSVLGQDVVTGWALPCVPYGGENDQGMLFIPEVGAGAWVEFEEGDLEYPIWVGTFWSKPGGTSELPRPNDSNGAEQSSVQDPPSGKIIKTLKGHTLQFEDKDNDESVMLIEGKHGHVVVMNQDGVSVTDGVNGHKVVLDSNGIHISDGKTSGNEVVMDSGGVVVKTSGTQALVTSSGVKIGGDAATEHLVLGDQFSSLFQTFLTAFNTHTHMGNLGAPTSPPPAPFLQNVPVSMKHTVE